MSCDQTEPRTAGECGPCSAARRNLYFPDKSMRAADFRIEQTYLIERRRLINRAMLGWGIVQGFPIGMGEQGIVIGRGVAIDACGREVVACEEVILSGPDDVLWLVKGECGMEPGKPPAPKKDEAPGQQPKKKRGYEEPQPEGYERQQEGYGGGEKPHLHYLLCAHYAEKRIDGVRVEDECGSTHCEFDHVCETVVYSLRPVTDCPPGLTDCLGNVWDRCGCPNEDDGWSCPPTPPDHPTVADVHDRGTHMQLVHWSIERLQNVNFCDPCEVDKCGHLYVDCDACVPLACVEIGFDDCDEPYIAQIVDDWRPKHLARPNNILFDLIRGCDLVRIQDVGWSAWLEPGARRVPLSAFTDMFEKPKRPEDAPRRGGARRRRGARAVADTHFWVCFSGPVQVCSLTPDVITITLVQRDLNEAVGNVVRVPIPAVEVAPCSEDDPEGTTRAFRPLVSGQFWEGEISEYDATGFETETLVEIEVRTAFILDMLGQEVAGGGRFVPTSGCVPGGRFLTSFVVVPDEEQDYGDREQEYGEREQDYAEPSAEEA